MILFVVGILIAIGGIALLTIGLVDEDGGMSGGGIAAIIVACALVFVSCIASIPTGHTGVLTTFGRVEDNTLDAGFHMKAPWQRVVKMDNRVQKATIDLSCFSSDIQEVSCKYALNYQISKANAQDIYRSIGKNYYDIVITPIVSEAVKVISAQYTAEQLIMSRADLAQKIEIELRNQLLNYNIEVVSTAIEDLDFTDLYTSAIEAKQVASQNKLKAETEQAQKTMEQEQAAARAIIDANAAAEVAKIQAEADLAVTKIQADAAEYAGQREASKNKAISQSLTDGLINYYYIQQWNGVLPESYVGSDSVSAIVGLN